MLSLEMLPAGHGDGIWLSWGDACAPRHLVIDGGPERSGHLRRAIEARMAAAPQGRLRIELLVVSHIDDDHIGGILELLESPPAGLEIGDVWFNGYRHLLPPDRLGPVQAERLSHAILRHGLPWNRAFDGEAVAIPQRGPLPVALLEGGLRLTLLGPEPGQLARLAPVWARVVRQHGLEPGAPPKDEAPSDRLGRDDPWPPDIAGLAARRAQLDTDRANGASIALLAEHDGRRLVLSADIFSPLLVRALERVEPLEGRLELAALQVPHHGSRKNLTDPLLDRIACRRYLISTNGAYSGHPDPEAIARILVRGGAAPEIFFNYRSAFTERWAETGLPGAPPFTARLPEPGAEGLRVEL